MRQSAGISQGAAYAPNLPRRVCLSILSLISAASPPRAGEIYKSLDAQGNVVYSDHLDPSMSHSTVVQLDDPRSPPSQLHFCWTNCFTLVLDDGVYRRVDGTDETWTIETFSSNAVALHRHDAPADWNGYSQDVVYAGQVSYDRLIGVTVNGKPVSGIDASWGSALNTLPGTNAERDSMTGANPSSSPSSSSSGTVSSTAAPPPLPEEDQPTLSQDGDLWTPGYWYWRDQRYVWIPGAWVRPPQVGFLWTPAYWGFNGAVFVFHPGHWGSTVGFYGGVNYGSGYFGTGYTGGHWVGNSFVYNSGVNHLDPAVAHHTYAESRPPGSQAVQHAGGSRDGNSAHPLSQHQSLERTVTQPAARTPERSGETSAISMKVSRPTVTQTSAPSTPAKFNHPIASRAAPVKQ